jgi:hypothetical protein
MYTFKADTPQFLKGGFSCNYLAPLFLIGRI